MLARHPSRSGTFPSHPGSFGFDALRDEPIRLGASPRPSVLAAMAPAELERQLRLSALLVGVLAVAAVLALRGAV